MLGRPAKWGKTGLRRCEPIYSAQCSGCQGGVIWRRFLLRETEVRPIQTEPHQEHAVAERSKYQDKIIKNYYQNKDAIGLQRLSELVTELYLAEGKGRERQWKNIVGALEKLKIPQTRIDHLVKQDNPALLAKLVEELMAKK
jgi:hypothetical protein